MGTTGPDSFVSLAALTHEPHAAFPRPTTWRADWDRRMANVSAWEVAERRFNRLLTLGSILRRCNRVSGDYGPARRWYVREAITRMQRLAARAGGAR